ncbi:MAG: hypothetical protein R3F30_03095 [Planctomycetota bacterium]
MSKQLFLIPALVLAGSLAAQVVESDFVVTTLPDSQGNGGGLSVVDPVKATVTPMTGVTGELVYAWSIAADPYSPAIWYVGTAGDTRTTAVDPEIHQVLVSAGKVLKDTKIATLKGEQAIVSLRVVGDELFFLTRTRVARMPKAGGTATTLFTHTNKWPTMSTDGRYVVSNIDGQGNGSQSVWGYDIREQKHTMLFQPNFPFPTSVRSVEPGADGSFLVIDSDTFGLATATWVDAATGKILSTTNVSGSFLLGALYAAEDAKTGDMLVVGRGKGGNGFAVYNGGKETKAFFGATANQINGFDVRRAPRLHLTGHACKPTLTPEPVLGANSVPEQGITGYKLSLTGPANTAGILLLGAHGALPGPVSLAGLGMGDCELGVLPLLTAGAVIPTGGTLDIPLPIPSTLGPANIDVQFALVDTGANQGGFVTTRVGGIIVR